MAEESYPTTREIPASKALKEYQAHADLAQRRIVSLEARPESDIPGTGTLKLLRGNEKGELSQEQSQILAKSIFENKEVNRFAVVGTLSESLSLTKKRLFEHSNRVEKGRGLGPEIDERKEQFLKSELSRKETLAAKIEENFHEGADPKQELISDIAKELVSQSRVEAYGEKFRALDLSNALALKHTCEQCVGYLKMLGDSPVEQHIGKDGKTWISPIEELRDRALLAQHERTKTQENIIER